MHIQSKYIYTSSKFSLAKRMHSAITDSDDLPPKTCLLNVVTNISSSCLAHTTKAVIVKKKLDKYCIINTWAYQCTCTSEDAYN